ncbi:hypothetical protein GCM10017781_20960 [Deinococcus metalli]|uniref:Ester cyclase n=1 Tax=Deinococcus metalli TaxID=1141878 RepID=A0ABQ3JQT7_9DEIO|nr:hypothetical protein GCM10017781_20960 [Deinococcus metalli]
MRLVRRVWEDKAIGLISGHYAHNTPVHLPDAELYGREALVARTLRTLATFPDVRLHSDEVIAGSDAEGLHTSHRLTVSGHHLGHALYGAPTGRRVHWRSITQRRVQGGRVVEEWSVHNELAVVRQLGLDEWAVARAHVQADAEAGTRPLDAGVGEVVRGTGQDAPPNPTDSAPRLPDALPGWIAAVVWNARRLDLAHACYAPDATVRVPGYRRLTGPEGLARYVLEWLAAFPDGAMHVEHVSSAEHGRGVLVAARWTFLGTHTGAGLYGPPTGRRVRIAGISHYDVVAGRIRREDMVWNELALLRQLCVPSTP